MMTSATTSTASAQTTIGGAVRQPRPLPTNPMRATTSTVSEAAGVRFLHFGSELGAGRDAHRPALGAGAGLYAGDDGLPAAAPGARTGRAARCWWAWAPDRSPSSSTATGPRRGSRWSRSNPRWSPTARQYLQAARTKTARLRIVIDDARALRARRHATVRPDPGGRLRRQGPRRRPGHHALLPGLPRAPGSRGWPAGGESARPQSRIPRLAWSASVPRSPDAPWSFLPATPAMRLRSPPPAIGSRIPLGETEVAARSAQARPPGSTCCRPWRAWSSRSTCAEGVLRL
ncbi:MAG: hypothetical protein MZW92_67965 [Comamonadaceae bacterium]|nr:hypothetical protein [Comamonadaceae bacterium]